MSRPMRFCMITTFYPPYGFGGDAVFVYHLSNALARLGHHVEVIHCIDSYHVLGGRPPEHRHRDHPAVTVHGLKSPFGFVSPLATQLTGLPLFKAARIAEILEKWSLKELADYTLAEVETVVRLERKRLWQEGEQAIKGRSKDIARRLLTLAEETTGTRRGQGRVGMLARPVGNVKVDRKSGLEIEPEQHAVIGAEPPREPAYMEAFFERGWSPGRR